MSKLYLFGIGGTGARVLRSLTMLLASGVDTGNVDTIVPVLIDPDMSNGDLTRTVELMKKYRSIHNELTFGSDVSSQFFKTSIDDQGTDFQLAIANVGNKTFGQYIEYDNLSKENKALISLLFSEKNLNAQMQEGFKGNPNMGSVVLNDFCSKDDYALSDLMQNFSEGDKIFIISSIFGGTGAAGFPLLLKTLRQADSFNFTNPSIIKNAPVGAISVLPYFGLKADADSEINMATFVSKAKSALAYYEQNLDTDALYYIADEMTSSYDNVEGSNAQINKTHFIEMAAALSIIDFIKSDVHRDANIYKEFASNSAGKELNLAMLSEQTRQRLATPLLNFYIFSQFFQHHLRSTFNQAWAKGRGLNEDILSNGFFTTLKKIIEDFKYHWLEEMASNNRAFKPFNISGYDNIFHSIVGYEPKKIGFMGRFFGNQDGFTAIDDEIAKVSNKIEKRLSDNDYFMSVHWSAINNTIKQRLNLQ